MNEETQFSAMEKKIQYLEKENKMLKLWIKDEIKYQAVEEYISNMRKHRNEKSQPIR